MNNKKFIAWDWNGTLLDDTDIVLECVNLALEEVDCPPISMSVLRETQSAPFEVLYRAVGVPEEKISILMQNSDIFHKHYERRSDRAPLRKGSLFLLKKLKANNISNIILSNHIANQIIRLLSLHKIHDLFDDVLAYESPEVQFCDITKGERLRRHIETKKLDASNAFIVGDTREEIKIGRDLGLSSVAVTGGILAEHLLRAEKPDYVIHSLDDLDLVLEEIGFVA
ncbi:MAG: HAD hydrolase-like protein [Bdellovibrionales bacterium]